MKCQFFLGSGKIFAQARLSGANRQGECCAELFLTSFENSGYKTLQFRVHMHGYPFSWFGFANVACHNFS